MDFAEQVRLDADAPQPLFDQLRTQIIDAVRGGQLVAGTKLPTVRALAARLELAVNTVAKTYRELETAGLIETRGRHGTFVSGADPADAAMAGAAHTYAELARSLGLGRVEAERYLAAAFANSV